MSLADDFEWEDPPIQDLGSKGLCLIGYVQKDNQWYSVAFALGAPRAPERLQALDRMLSSDEKAKAVELAKSIRSELRPIPTQVVFQYAGNQPPSPWSALPSAPIRR